MEANQVDNQPSVCPKCGKSVQSDFTRCPYCGAKLTNRTKENRRAKNNDSKSKDFFVSISNFIISHKKIAIVTAVVLALIIVIIPIISVFTSPFNSFTATRVDVGIATESDILNTYGEPDDIITNYNTLGVANNMCKKAWVYYEDSFAKKLKAYNDKKDLVSSLDDLINVNSEYEKLTKESYSSLVIGITDNKVTFVALNKSSKYAKDYLFASSKSKELKNCTLSSKSLCKYTSIADANITYVAKYKDGSVVKAMLPYTGSINYNLESVSFDIQSIWGNIRIEMDIIEHQIGEGCICKNCGLTIHDLDIDCKCNLCHNVYHEIEGCECKNCTYNTHDPDDRCVCRICNSLAHTYELSCECVKCGAESHKLGKYSSCIRCNNYGIIYEKVSNQYCQIVDCIGLTGKVVIPSTYYGIPVKVIEHDAFCYCEEITDITLPNSLEMIGDFAFGNCKGLTNIVIPSSVYSINNSAFNFCSGINSITVEDGNSSYYSEGNCLISKDDKSVILGCKTSTIPADGSVKSIDEWAFTGCTGLTIITIPDSVISIGEWAFYECSNLRNLNLGNGVEFISSCAFRDCVSLKSVTIPNSVKQIDTWAFLDCTNLSNVVTSDSITLLGGGVFYNTPWAGNLMDITYVGKVFFKYVNVLPTDGSPIVDTSVTIQDGTTQIAGYAFWNRTELVSVDIPSSMRRISVCAFKDCTKLETINYNGTMADWNNIVKEDGWDSDTVNYTIYCTDGTISK
ncbi:MAG: leucine-rich repeat protein [Christensenellales bacterium]